MAQVDANIILSGKDYDFANSFRSGLAAKKESLVNNAFAKQQAEEENLNNIYRQSGGDLGKMKTALAQTGTYAQGKSIGADQSAADKERIEGSLKKLEVGGQLFSSVNDPISFENARAQLVQLYPEADQHIPRTYDPKAVEQFRAQSMSVAQQLQNEWLQKNYDQDDRQFNREMDLKERNLQLDAWKAQNPASGGMEAGLSPMVATINGQQITVQPLKSGGYIDSSGQRVSLPPGVVPVPLTYDPNIVGRRAAGILQGENTGNINVSNQRMAGPIEQAKSLLGWNPETNQWGQTPDITQSGVGAAADKAGSVFGISTKSAENADKLETIAGWMTSAVPRMQGPQSNFDVQQYQKMAADLGNRNIPVARRRAALEGLILLREKYGADANAAPGQQNTQPAQALAEPTLNSGPTVSNW